MNVNERESLNALFEAVVGAAYEVSNTLGAGFLAASHPDPKSPTK